MSDQDLLDVLGESILGAARVLRDGKPAAALDMIDIVLMALPDTGAETIELAALPTKIIALGQLGRTDEAHQVLGRMEGLAASHGGDDERRACEMLREQALVPDLGRRANLAMEAIQAGDAEAVGTLEALAAEAEAAAQPIVALGALVFLGSIYQAVHPGQAHDRLSRARHLLETTRPLDEARHALALGEIDRMLDELDRDAS